MCQWSLLGIVYGQLMLWDHKVGRISGLIGEYKKVKEYRRVCALSHTEIVWFESSDRPN